MGDETSHFVKNNILILNNTECNFMHFATLKQWHEYSGYKFTLIRNYASGIKCNCGAKIDSKLGQRGWAWPGAL